MEGKDRFIKVYSNLPIDVRTETILVIDNIPVSWNVAYSEIENETEFGKKILSKLIELEFI